MVASGISPTVNAQSAKCLLPLLVEVARGSEVLRPGRHLAYPSGSSE